MRPLHASSRDRWTLIAALVAGGALRLYRLGAESLWYDESVSVFLAQQPLAELVARTARDIHPPGYYALLHLWQSVVQPTPARGLEFLYAWISAACGLLIVALLYPIGRRLVGRPAALVGVWLAAVGPFHLWYSQEVRMYTLGGLFGLLALYATLRWLGEEEGGGGQTRWLLLYAAAAAGGLYTFYYFLFVLAGIGLAALLLAPSARRFGLWLASHLGLLLLYAPWLGIFRRQATDPPVPPWRTPWATPGELAASLGEALAAYTVGQTPPGPLWPWALLTAAAALGALWFARAGRRATQHTTRRGAAALLAYTFAPLLLIAAVSLLATPLYHVRYLYPAAAPFALLLGSLVTGLWARARAAGALLMAALLVSSALALRAFWTDPAYRADDHRAAVAALATAWRPGDLILVNAGWVYPLLEVYWPQEPTAEEPLPPPPADPVRLGQEPADDGRVPLVRTGSVDGDPGLGWGDPQSDFFAQSAAETSAALDALAAGHERLWHFRLYDTVSDPQGHVRAWLDANTTLLRDDAIPGRDFGRLELRDLGHAPQPDPAFAPVDFGDALRLLRAQAPATVTAGSLLYVPLVWEALPGLESLPVGLSSSLRLYDAAGNSVAQADVGPARPTTSWLPGERVRDPLAVGVPAALPPGDYALDLIVYRQDDAMPLPLDDVRAVDGQRLRLGTVTVIPR